MPRRNGTKRINYINRGKSRNKKKRDYDDEESPLFKVQTRDIPRD